MPSAVLYIVVVFSSLPGPAIEVNGDASGHTRNLSSTPRAMEATPSITDKALVIAFQKGDAGFANTEAMVAVAAKDQPHIARPRHSADSELRKLREARPRIEAHGQQLENLAKV